MGVLGVAGFSAYKEGQRSKEQAKTNRAFVVGGVSKREVQIKMAAVTTAGRCVSSTVCEARLPDGWHYSTDLASGASYVTFQDAIQSMWAEEVMMAAKYIEANPTSRQQQDESSPSDVSDAKTAPTEEFPMRRPARTSTVGFERVSVASSSAMDFDELFGGASAGTGNGAPEIGVWSTNVNPLRTRNEAGRETAASA